MPDFLNYELLGEIGRGGMGVVYEARDRRTGRTVALKMMQHGDPGALARFKQEARALQEVVHPNLVTVYEVVHDGRDWFFTMELIRGRDFLRHVRDDPGPAAVTAAQPPTAPDGDAPTQDAPTRDAPAGLGPTQLVRLRRALRQLAEGLSALHAAGKIHRDVKPSNVLVKPDGHLKLLDFGLSAALDPAGLHQSTSQHVVGTWHYMAPEQAAGEVVTPASDWYSVGVLLYQSLTGRLPFAGSLPAVLSAKSGLDPTPPGEVVPGIPEDLDALCRELLRREPAGRPCGRMIRERLSGGDADPGSPAPDARAVPLVGRERHLHALAAALEAARGGGAAAVAVHGRSGVGKSALLGHFLDRVRRSGEAVVLAGRCYEREAVPYKALDSAIDALARHLRQPGSQAERLLPRDVWPLARMFPALQRVPAVAEAPRPHGAAPDPQEARRRASAALRELLARLGDRRPVVISLDDLQWGDIDSAVLLGEVLRPPDPPRLLLLACHRSDGGGAGPFLRALAGEGGAVWAGRLDLPLEPLAGAEAQRLAAAMLGPGGAARAEAVARESGGNPFFLGELAQWVRSGAEGGPEVSLDGLIRARAAALPDADRRLLEAVAVSGRPVGVAEAFTAARAEADEGAVVRLQGARLLRSAGGAARPAVETYHDRVREAVTAGLTAEELRGYHRRLAGAMTAGGEEDAETLAGHYRGAGEPARAAGHYARAADGAAAALAFDRAACLYRLALELDPVAEAGQRQTRLGDALANAGRGEEAARAYLDAAGAARTTHALELRRRAAEQFLRSGHFERGFAVLRDVLQGLGIRLPERPGRALLSLAFRRRLLWFRGLSFRERPPEQIAPEQLLRLDVLATAALGLSLVDPLRAAGVQTRYLHLALNSGDPYRVTLGLAWEASASAFRGGRGRRRAQHLLERAGALARGLPDRHAAAVVTLNGGITALLTGHWRESLALCGRAEVLLRDHCRGVAWELNTAQLFALNSLLWLGELREYRRRLAGLLEEGKRRGDHYATRVVPLLCAAYFPRLVCDGPERVEEDLAGAANWPAHDNWNLQRWHFLTARVECALYRRHGRHAWELIAKDWRAVLRSLLGRVQIKRILMSRLRATAALAAAEEMLQGGERSGEATPLLRVVEQEARRIARERMPYGDAIAEGLRAGADALAGRGAAALSRLAAAEQGFVAAEMHLSAAAARRRRGQLLGGAEGRCLIEAADDWMRSQEIRDPARVAAMLAPGFGD